MKLDKGKKTCSICKKPFLGFGHNPEPIMGYENRCCESCNVEVVIPVRIFGMQNPIALNALRRYGFTVKEKKHVVKA